MVDNGKKVGFGCYNCTKQEDEDITLFPRSLSNDQHSILQDVRCIRGLLGEALLQPDYSVHDVLRWIKEDQLRLDALGVRSSEHRRVESTPYDPATATFLSTDRICRASVLPNFRLSKIFLTLVYFLAVVLQAIWLVCNHFHVFRKYGFIFRPAIPFLPLKAAAVQTEHVLPEQPPGISSVDLDFERFEIFFSVSLIPMPFLFGIVMLCSAGMMRRLLNVMLAGVCERVRRSVAMTSTEALCVALPAFVERVKYYFETLPTLENQGLPDITAELNVTLDDLNNSALRFDSSCSTGLFSKVPTLKQSLHKEVFNYWNSFYFTFYILPIIFLFIADFGIVSYIFRRALWSGWSSEEQDFLFFCSHPFQALGNESLQWIFGVICLHWFTLFWVIVVLANDFTTFFIESPSAFGTVSHAAADYANNLVSSGRFISTAWTITQQLAFNLEDHSTYCIAQASLSGWFYMLHFFAQIRAVWDAVIVRGITPYIIARKFPLPTSPTRSEQQTAAVRNNAITFFDVSSRYNSNQVPGHKNVEAMNGLEEQLVVVQQRPDEMGSRDIELTVPLLE